MPNTPPDLTEALVNAGLAEFFAGCTNAHRNEYLKWIGEAKRPETSNERIAKTIKLLGDKCVNEKARKGVKNR